MIACCFAAIATISGIQARSLLDQLRSSFCHPGGGRDPSVDCSCVGAVDTGLRRYDDDGHAGMSSELTDRTLPGNWAGDRDCHLWPDLLLIYAKPSPDVLRLVRLVSHSELFE
jgi:hypothetical protein